VSDKKKMPLDPIQDGLVNKAGRLATRRGFLRTAIVSGVALGATAAAAKKAGDALFKDDVERRSRAEERMAHDSLKGKKLVLMSEAEKKEMLKAFEADAK
jgi:hypothetical protein